MILESIKAKKHSIVVTIGPSSISPVVLKNLVRAGATSFRINLSHSTMESLKFFIKTLTNNGIQFSIDTQGAQLRVINTNVKNKAEIGEKIYLFFGNEYFSKEKDGKFIRFNHPEAFLQVQKGDIIKVDFNGLVLEINSIEQSNCCLAEVISPGNLLINRSVDISSKILDLKTLSDFDKKAIEYSLSKNCKEIYGSFISSADDFKILKKEVGDSVKIISKVETARAVANINEILELSDEILIDRGDLSREISITSLPMAVFNILRIANKVNKRVNIATNVLDSMMSQKIPSRSEISDIFAHLAAGASGIVLAAEVAIGENPVSSTALVKYIIDTFINFQNGLHGIGTVKKPPLELVGEELYHWL